MILTIVARCAEVVVWFGIGWVIGCLALKCYNSN